jgi:hypothetical protein
MPRTKRITDTPEAARKGIKTAKGQPIFYSEKKQRVNLTLTPTASEGLEKFAQVFNLSVSEFVERIGRGTIPLLIADSAEPEPGTAERLDQRRIVEAMGKPCLPHNHLRCGTLQVVTSIVRYTKRC